MGGIKYESELNWMKFFFDIIKFIIGLILAYCTYIYLKSEESIFNKNTTLYDRISKIIFDDKTSHKKKVQELNYLEKYYNDGDITKQIINAKEYLIIDTATVSFQKKIDTLPSSDKKSKKILKSNLAFIAEKQDSMLAGIFDPYVESSYPKKELNFFSISEGLIEWKPRWKNNDKFTLRVLDSIKKLKNHLKKVYEEMHKLPENGDAWFPQLAGSKFQSYEKNKLEELRETIRKMDSIEFKE